MTLELMVYIIILYMWKSFCLPNSNSNSIT